MTLYTNAAALVLATTIRTLLAASHLKLFKAISPPLSVSTVVGDITEADFTGYAAAAIANFLIAYLDPAGGASIQSGTIQFNCTGTAVPNTVLGFYLEDAAGDLILIGTFDSPIAMTQVGDSIPVNVTLNFAANG